MAVPLSDIAECRISHERLQGAVQLLDDKDMRRSSRLPGWTVGHVVAHLARNADSVVRRLHAVIEGRVIEQYEGGPAGRAAEIEAGSVSSAAQLHEDLVRADHAVDELFGRVPDEAWERPFATVNAKPEFTQRPASFLPFTRWREVETHHVDLGIGYEPADWPDALIDRWLPGLLEELPARSDARQLMAWTLGRGTPPSLDPWS
ncbi:MAG TPA: maleylpyruvate isomerase N-terminal domain-containing protein [Frankiaceae bacterium]|jgi:maleylpyruvate isomerase|nr:maleylpyruvate isomerase N-terminal domain-containing protein [Frankiaceae bacterium]